MNNILITHEFPNDFYQTGYAETHTDFDYCLIHRYLDTPSYAEYMRNAVKKGRTVYLDNGVYELGKAFNWEDYVKVIKELRPTYYILPDVFNQVEDNIDSQITFYNRYYEDILEEAGSLPIAIPHGLTLDSLKFSIKIFDNILDKKAIIAIPFGSAAFEKDGIYSEKDIPYIPVRQAMNRKSFVIDMLQEFPNRKYHLLGCKSICEFDNWDDEISKENIVSIDTSIPVALSFEGLKFKYSHFYKPLFLIDKNFNMDQPDESTITLINKNIKTFKRHVNMWHNNYN